MLISDSVESLLAKNSELVHEIRVGFILKSKWDLIFDCLTYMQTLDGEMQKLVYDNYNKFITATETIKEMKNDVYGMDDDMESVRYVDHQYI